MMMMMMMIMMMMMMAMMMIMMMMMKIIMMKMMMTKPHPWDPIHLLVDQLHLLPENCKTSTREINIWSTGTTKMTRTIIMMMVMMTIFMMAMIMNTRGLNDDDDIDSLCHLALSERQVLVAPKLLQGDPHQQKQHKT